jgi:biopolymer transport protein ExbD
MAMQVGESSSDDVMIDINTTPLIDVMLVLIIMLIITIAPSAAPPKPPEIVRIDIDFDGTIGWNGTVVEKDELINRLAQVAQQPDQPEVHLRPNKLVTYKVVAMVMANAQRLGVTKIGLIGNEQFLN